MEILETTARTWHNLCAMALKFNGFWSATLWVSLAGALAAQAPPQPAAPAQESPTFRVQIDAVTMDVIVKDAQGRFIAGPEEGRVRGLRRRRQAGHRVDDDEPRRARHERARGAAAAAARRRSSCRRCAASTTPPAASSCSSSTTCTCSSRTSGRVRELFKKISKKLVHEGDMFGIVSSGPSSIAIDMTYDRKRLDEAIKKIAGRRPEADRDHPDLARARKGRPSCATARTSRSRRCTRRCSNLETVHNRRKALVWVSDGYDFNPFQESRLGLRDPSSPFTQNAVERHAQQPAAGRRHDAAERRPDDHSSRSRPRRSATPISPASSAR